MLTFKMIIVFFGLIGMVTALVLDKMRPGMILFSVTVLFLCFGIGEFYQFNLSSCIRQQNSLTAQFVSFSLANLANIFYPPRFLQ